MSSSSPPTPSSGSSSFTLSAAAALVSFDALSFLVPFFDEVVDVAVDGVAVLRFRLLLRLGQRKTVRTSGLGWKSKLDHDGRNILFLSRNILEKSVHPPQVDQLVDLGLEECTFEDEIIEKVIVTFGGGQKFCKNKIN